MNYTDANQWVTDLGSGYSQIRPLGEGGMGTLYQAHKDSLDVDVVIKRVKQKFKGRMDERAEANILKTLKHRYLPRIYDVIESPSGYVYTIMDLIEGENMQKYVEAHGPVDQKLAYRWACQLCEVVSYLHAQTPPILHCDIKPSNIMITPSGDLCVIDFNTSLVFSKGALAIGATPGYAAPEQYTRPAQPVYQLYEQETLPLDITMPFNGYGDAAAYQKPSPSSAAPSVGSRYSHSVTAAQATGAGGYGSIGKQTDVYGIGATLYYAITGQQPNHSLNEVRPITSYKLSFSRTFLSVILRSMQKQPTDRFCDAQEMLRALTDIHAIDRRYKTVARAQTAVAVLSVSLLAAGLILIGVGTQRIGVERYAAYNELVRTGRTAGEEMRFADAQTALNEAVSIYDDQLEAYVEQAVLLYRQGRYQECIDAVETTSSRALKYESEQSVANLYNIAAQSYYALENYENAVRMYQKAIEYSPAVSGYYQGLATAQIQLGDLPAAQSALHQMCTAIPGAEQSADYQLVKSELARKDGQPLDALSSAMDAILLSDDADLSARAYRLAASIYEELGDETLDSEIQLLHEGIESLPAGYFNALAGPLAAAHLRRAEYQDNNADRQEALKLYQLLYENGNTSLEIRLNIAMLQYQLRQFTNALEVLQQLAQDYPKDYRVFMWLAFVQGELAAQKGGNYNQTLVYYQTATELYRTARSSGVYDPQMDELERICLNYWQ